MALFHGRLAHLAHVARRNDPSHQLTIGWSSPAAALLRPEVALDIQSFPAWSRFLKPFWRTVTALVLLIILSLSRRFPPFRRN
jgi:hypothetical protein